jgi:flagellum-specific peptidoglycan hydrolase FlgJ
MTPKEFTLKYYPFARKSEQATGVPALVIMAQAALESAWGKVAPGNMFFGVKDADGLNGNEQLLLTTEYLDSPDKQFPAVLSVVQVGKRLWKYKVKDWFRKYATPEESFTDHAHLFVTRSRYRAAMKAKNDPYLFAAEIHKAGYATDPDYAWKLHKLIDMIRPYTTGL